MSMRHWLGCLFALVTLMLMTTALPGTARAQMNNDVGYNIDEALGTPVATEGYTSLKTVDASGNAVRCEDLEEVQGGKIIGKIVPCMVRTIQNATQRFSAKMIDWLRPLLYTFLTLVIILYGFRMFSGEPQTHTHGLVLLIKVGLVITVLDMIPDTLVPATYSIMRESQGIVVNALSGTGLACESVPLPDGSTASWGGPNTMPVWAVTDCILGKLFGFTVTGNGQPGMFLGASLLGVMSGFLFGGAWGVVVFFGILGVLVSLFMLVVRTVYSFLVGYLMICFVLIISPLILPLMFMRATQNYAEPIWRNILSSFLMPIVVTSYAMLGLMLYDRMLFADDSMLKTLFSYAKVSPAQLPPAQPCSELIVNDINNRTKAGQNLATSMKNSFMQIFANPTAAGNNDLCAGLRIPKFDARQIQDPAFQKGSETYTKIFEQLMVLLILGYLLNIGLRSLDGIVSQLSLSSGSINTLSGIVAVPQQRLSEALASSRDAAISAFDRKTGTVSEETNRLGANFIKPENVGGAIRNGVGAFFGNITKSKD